MNAPLQAVTLVGFDADDTLWQNERFFRLTQDAMVDLLADHAEKGNIVKSLEAAERRNLAHYGFGIKGFTLSMIESALEVTENRVPAEVIARLVALGKDMLAHPIELLPGVEETVAKLADSHTLVLITKGDLLHQEQKLAASGLGEMFRAVEIVSNKDAATYRRAFAQHGSGPEQAVMVGNSLRSDVLPALEAGAYGVHVPHDLTWVYEHADVPLAHPRFHEIADLAKLPDLLGV